MRKQKEPQEQTRFEAETFRRIIGSWSLNNLIQKEPDCFNGEVSIRKWRVVVEMVDEPISVIHERLRKLWRECNNHHHYAPLRAEAAKYGLELDSKELGKERKP